MKVKIPECNDIHFLQDAQAQFEHILKICWRKIRDFYVSNLRICTGCLKKTEQSILQVIF